MPTSGSGTMTPVTPGAPGAGLDIALPIPYTLLSLPRYARIMGINPLHFARGATPGLDPIVFPTSGCDDIWFKYDWQDNDKVSWWQLAHLILDAEKEIAEVVGYWSAPMWIVDEPHRYEAPFLRTVYGLGYNVRGDYKGVNAKYGKFISAGRRTTTLIGTATSAGGTLVYSDEDGDSYSETATITLPTTLTDPKEIKVYFSGTDANPDWEVRSPKSITISGGNVVIVFDSWALIDPDLYEEYPTSDGMGAIDVSTTANLVTSIEVYREYADTTQVSSEFYWETQCEICGGSGCEACGITSQDGCLQIRNYDLGIVIPVPASYDTVDGRWEEAGWVEQYEPDIVKLWYRAGALDERYLRGYSVDPLSHFWAQAIAWIATSRLERPLCGCINTQALAEDLRTDLALSERGLSRFVYEEVYQSPFGTRKGEVMAWRRIKRLVKDKRVAVAVV